MANEQTPAPTSSTNSGAAVEDNQNSIIASKPERFTNATGAPVPDNTNILTAGPRGPALLQDIWLIEKLAHFDREVTPERRMHAKGWQARSDPEGVQCRAEGRQEDLSGRSHCSRGLGCRGGCGEEDRSRRESSLRAGPHRCCAGADRCGVVCRSRTARRRLPQLR